MKKGDQVFNLIIGTVLIVVFFIMFDSIMDQLRTNASFAKWYEIDLYTDHHSTPYLVINYTVGKPGSYFKVTGCNYPANNTATITINGNHLGTMQVDNIGCLVFELSTALAEDGSYFVTVSVNPSATINFRLDSNSSNTWPSEGASTLFSVPAGIAFTESIYLPIILR